MEVTTLKQAYAPARPAPGPLLRLASDERLITLVRRGHHAAFEALVQRYQSRLLAFCRHMLGSREDAEDVLQDVFAAAFNAILADERPINVRPWLYRIARNRSLNHLRRASAVGMDSMDTYFADHGQSVPERILQRENFNALVEDIGRLAETQRTALLLREIDALSYEQIAEVMDTTVPSVKSLLVRARVALAEAAEARQLSCEEVRHELAEVAEGLTRISPPVRRHVRDCARCRSFSKQLKHNERALAALLPIGGIPALLHRVLATKLGSTGAHGAYAASGGGAVAGASAASGLGGAGGLAGLGGGAVAAKAVAGLAAAALLTAGAVEVGHNVPRAHAPASAPAVTTREASTGTPAVVSSEPQALTASHASVSTVPADARQNVRHARAKHHPATAKSTQSSGEGTTDTSHGTAAAAQSARDSSAHGSSSAASAPVLQVTTVTTQSQTSTSAPEAAPVASTPPAPAPGPETTSATGPTGPTGASNTTGATGESTPAPPSEAQGSTGANLESGTGGTQAPPAAAEAPAAG
jgi:RNA polymerase sigma factor (sigma-70 family)